MKLLAVTCALCAGFVAAVAPGLARGSAQAQSTLTWSGWSDQVGQWWQTTPNGFRDGHFVLTVDAPGAIVTRLSLNPVVKATGAVSGADQWDTSYKSGKWPLGVARGGTLLNNAFQPLCDAVGATAAVYDIYAEDTGVMNTDVTYRVTAELSDGQKLTADATIGSVAGGLPRAPKPFNFPTVPRPDANAACVNSGQTSTTPPPPTTTTTTTTATTPKPPVKKTPVCKKGQKSTAKKPCRKPKR